MNDKSKPLRPSLEDLDTGALLSDALSEESPDETVTNKGWFTVGNLIKALIVIALAAALYLPDRRVATEFRSLLSDISIDEQTISGEWKKTSKGIESTNDEAVSLLRIPLDPYPEEVEFRWRLTRLSGTNSIGLFFQSPHGFGSLELDAWEVLGLAGVQVVGETDLRDSGSFQLPARENETIDLRLQVLNNRIHVYQGDDWLQTYEMQSSTLSPSEPWNLSEDITGSNMVTLATWKSRVRFEALEWRALLKK